MVINAQAPFKSETGPNQVSQSQVGNARLGTTALYKQRFRVAKRRIVIYNYEEQYYDLA